MVSYDYAVIGNSAAGIATVEGIRKRDPNGTMIMISQESSGIYSRPLLSHFIAGKIIGENLKFRPDEFYQRNNVVPLLGRKVVRVLPDRDEIILEGGESIGYRRLMVATGSHPVKLEIPGSGLRNVFGLHDERDARAISVAAVVARKAIVLGGGPVGVGIAQALRARGLDVTVMISSGRVLSQLLDDEGSELVRERMERNGVKVIPNTSVAEILGGVSVTGVRTEDGSTIESDMVIVSKGVEPNIEMVRDTGIHIEQGIVVDRHMRSSFPNIFAAGDVAMPFDLILGGMSNYAIWPNASEQGRVGGENMAGANVEYPGAMAMNSVNVFGLPLIAIGVVRPKVRAGVSFMRRGIGENYRCLVVKDDRIIGAILIGKIGNAGVFSMLIKRNIDISEVRNMLLADDFDRGKLIDLGIIGKKDINP